MQDQPSETPKEPEKEHRFLPRFVGLIAGVVGGIFTAKILRDMSFNDFIRKGLAQVEMPDNPGEVEYVDSYVTHVWKKMQAVLKNFRQMELFNNFDSANVPLEEWKQANEKFKNAVEKLKIIRNEAVNAASKNMGNSEKRVRELINAGNNYKYGIQLAKEKAFFPEIIKEMQFKFRHSQHKKWIFAGSTVALCAVGYATYKATDWLMNSKEKKNHRQAITDRRSSGESAGTAVT